MVRKQKYIVTFTNAVKQQIVCQIRRSYDDAQFWIDQQADKIKKDYKINCV